MSTLVNIPFYGKFKYGGFIVYDTNHKKLALDVTEENLYTHECAKQMAVGTLKNSKASIAIAVTGNSMPDHTLAGSRKLGEVYLGIASYDITNIVIVETYKLCLCDIPLCVEWAAVAAGNEGKYNSSENTSIIHNIIRYNTVEFAYKKALLFLQKTKLIVPTHVLSKAIPKITYPYP